MKAINSVLDLTVSYTGQINRTTLRGAGKGRYDVSGATPSRVVIRYSEFPAKFHPFAIGATFVTIGIGAAREHGDAKNLWNLTGGNYTFERQINWPALRGSEIIVRAGASSDGRSLHLDADYQGTYRGPVDLKTVLMFEGYLNRPRTPKTIVERGRAVILRDDGEVLEAIWDCQYRGLSRSLPVKQQRATMSPQRLIFHDGTLELRWFADMWPSRPPTTGS